jgi:hypothetical protein
MESMRETSGKKNLRSTKMGFVLLIMSKITKEEI